MDTGKICLKWNGMDVNLFAGQKKSFSIAIVKLICMFDWDLQIRDGKFSFKMRKSRKQ